MAHRQWRESERPEETATGFRHIRNHNRRNMNSFAGSLRMNISPRDRTAVVGYLLLGLGLIGCGGSPGASTSPNSMPAPTATLQAADSQVTPGQSVVLTWKSSNAQSVTIEPSISAAALPLTGSVMVAPKSTTTYQMTATGAGGSASSNVTVTVAAAGTPTVTLVASLATISSGGNAKLTWTSSNASSVSISPAVGTGSLPLSGSVSIAPAATTAYTITAIHGQQTATASATVTVQAPAIAQSPIQHVIVVIMQNHSFDNLFGTYPMANGLDPSAPSYSQIDANGVTVSPTLLTSLTTPDVNHDGHTYTEAYDGGKMDKYAATNGDLSMQYFDSTVTGTANDGKTYGMGDVWSYAQQYALADNFFASAMDSEPANMLYMIAATVHDDRTAGSEPYYDHCSAQDVAKDGGTIAQPLTETNIGDQLIANKVSWAWYQGNYSSSQNVTCVDYVPQENPFQYFTSTQYSTNLMDFSLTNFQKTLSDGSLPSVVWITPAPVAGMHPGSGDMANGIQWLDNLVASVKSSPAWSSTAIVLLWDESGGWYDHVPPPQLANTLGLGARVPVIVVSPYAKAGAISHQQMDFVSILRFIQWNWGLGKFTDPVQSAREQQSGDICDLLTIPCSSP
jgi:phospholipase C